MAARRDKSTNPFSQQDDSQTGPAVQLPFSWDTRFGPGLTGIKNPRPAPGERVSAGGGTAGSGGGGGGLPSTPTSDGLGSLVNAPGSGTSMTSGGGMNFGKFFGKLDPTALLLSGMSLLGGDDGPQQRKSFLGSGRTDPKYALGRAMQLNDELVQEIRNRMASRQKHGPVVLPELPMQIGGGLGANPANRQLPELKPTQRRKPQSEQL